MALCYKASRRCTTPSHLLSQFHWSATGEELSYFGLKHVLFKTQPCVTVLKLHTVSVSFVFERFFLADMKVKFQRFSKPYRKREVSTFRQSRASGRFLHTVYMFVNTFTFYILVI
jgi:hypothetical protein